MPDREKTIKGLTDIGRWIAGRVEFEMARNFLHTIDDAVAMLKEQDKPKGHWMPYEPDKRGYTNGFTCSRCERVILSDHYCKMIDFDFCPYCGAYMDNAEGR